MAVQSAARSLSKRSSAPLLRVLLICVALVALTVSIYWPVSRFEFVNYDDTDYVSANPTVQGGLSWAAVKWALTTGHASNWHPLTWLSHMLDCQLFGVNAGAHHLTNLFFHIANTLLLLGILQRMTGALWRSAFVAALFALHPLHVESIAWVSERKDVLSTFVLLLTLAAYFGYARRPAAWRFLLVVVLYALGLMAKPMLVTLPFALLLLDYWPLKRFSGFQSRVSTLGARNAQHASRLLAKLVWEKTPLFLLAAGSCVATYFAQRGWGAIYPTAQLPVSARLANAVVSYVRYLGKMVWPADMAIPYPYPGGWPAWQVMGAGVVLIGISAAAVAMAKKRPYCLTGWLWYVGTLVPVIGLVQVGMQAMADRYTYIPLIGIFVVVVWGISELTGKWLYGRAVAVIAGAFVLAACTAVTREQLQYWRNTETLFGHTVAVTRNNFFAHYNLANRLAAVGKLDEAVAHYEAAVRARPDYANAHNNLGNALDKLGRTAEAAQHYAEALKFSGGAAARVNLGNSLLTAGKVEEAISHYTETLRLSPDSLEAHNSLGVALVRQDKVAEAVSHFRTALQIKPDFVDARANLAAALAQQRNVKEAVEQYQLVLRANPKHFDAHRSLGDLLAEAGQIEEAIDHYRKAKELNPNHASVCNGLGLALAMQGKMEEAAEQFRDATRLSPENASVLGSLGNALAALGKHDEAIQCYEAALKLAPNDEQVHNNLANTLATQGKLTKATGHYAAALKINPANPETHFNFSLLLLRAGKRDEAIAHLREALRSKPDYTAARNQLATLTGSPAN